jgi:phosphoribosylformimino-5-aminoimidazole carboxamide ribotide isomerase
MLAAVSCRVIASGGISRREDVLALLEMKKRRPNLGGVIIGKALYEQRLDLGDLLALAGALEGQAESSRGVSH